MVDLSKIYLTCVYNKTELMQPHCYHRAVTIVEDQYGTMVCCQSCAVTHYQNIAKSIVVNDWAEHVGNARKVEGVPV